jgi:hypothetical protein
MNDETAPAQTTPDNPPRAPWETPVLRKIETEHATDKQISTSEISFGHIMVGPS